MQPTNDLLLPPLRVFTGTDDAQAKEVIDILSALDCFLVLGVKKTGEASNYFVSSTFTDPVKLSNAFFRLFENCSQLVHPMAVALCKYVEVHGSEHL